jgi:hypothetical protein
VQSVQAASLCLRLWGDLNPRHLPRAVFEFGFNVSEASFADIERFATWGQSKFSCFPLAAPA